MVESLDKAIASLLKNSNFLTNANGLTIFALALVVGLVGHFIIKNIIVKYLRFFSERTETSLDDHLLKLHVFDRLAGLFPAIIIYIFCTFVFRENNHLVEVVRKLVILYFIYLTTRCLISFLAALDLTYRELPTSKNRPIKSYLQMIKLLILCTASIIAISTIINRSPIVLLSGLGALTAILLLVFKDAILGLVASIQLAANDMVRIGDWIEMSNQDTDGEVFDINLTTIKIRNWDNTISMIPAHLFTSGAFKNWRGMSDSGGRRIKRSLPIDMSSIRFCDQEMLERFKKMTILIPYLDDKINQIEDFNSKNNVNLDDVVNGRRLTNLD